MFKYIAFVLAILGFAVVTPHDAEARVFVGVGVGCCGYYPGYYPGYYYPYGPAYYAPPPVVYAVPPSPPVMYAPSAVPADQTSPTFVDGLGRTCRQYQAGNGATGTACLQPDGTWRVAN